MVIELSENVQIAIFSSALTLFSSIVVLLVKECLDMEGKF